MNIGKVKININTVPALITEISGNHGGKLANAIKLVKTAAQNGADLIKLQTYEGKNLTLNSENRGFIINNKKSLWKKNKLYDLYKKGETKKEWHYKIFKEAKKYNVECFTSIFDADDINFLEKLKVPAYKIASFECLHFPLIERVIKTKKPIIISTGLSTKEEVNNLVKFLKKNNCKKYILLKCTSSYPASSKDLNLSTISDMRKKYKCEVGYSDHSIGSNAAIGAVHNGATVIEKHICLNKNIGIDSKFSLEIKNLKFFKNQIIDAFYAKGKIFYGATKNEMPNLQFRRSIYSSKNIKKGEKFSKSNIKIIRPSYGLEPKYYNFLLGKKSLSNIKFAHPIKMKNVKK